MGITRTRADATIIYPASNSGPDPLRSHCDYPEVSGCDSRELPRDPNCPKSDGGNGDGGDGDSGDGDN
ncbi:hypothetical protein ABW20_dc0105048 [Dactylellina cionopaga]|nr:hypothetical protein ABW20_dc0105048 [Dactylellina cionopaga]